MKIAHVVESFAGGVLTAVSGLANHFTERGSEVTVVHSRRPDTPANINRFFLPQVELIEISMPSGISPLGDIEASRKVRAAIELLRPDVVHLHSSKAGAIGRLAMRGSWGPQAPRLIYSPHGFSFIRKDVSGLKRAVFFAAEQALQHIAPAHIVGCASPETELARKLDPGAVTIHNAVDVARIERAAATGRSVIVSDGAPVVAMVGRITPQRSPGMFERIALKVRTAYPHVRFVWIGDGDGWNFDPLLVEKTGWLPREDALATLSSASVCVHSAQWDGMPFAVLEAMALGKPVVATPVGGVADAIEFGETGFYAEGVDDLASYVKGLVTAPARAHVMGFKGKLRARELFDETTYFERWSAMYGERTHAL